MQTGTVTIGGKDYPVEALKVSEAMKCDMALQQAKNEDEKIKARMSRVAIALRKGKAFLPDPENLKGEFRADQRSVDEVIEAIDEIFSSMKEWYDAELMVAKLNGYKPDEGKKGGPVGEIAAEPEKTSESGTSPASAA